MPRNEPPYTVLIGDDLDARIKLFATVLQEDYRSQLIAKSNWNDLAAEVLNRRDVLDLVILCTDRRGEFEGRSKERVRLIKEHNGFNVPIIAVSQLAPKFSQRDKVYPLVWSASHSPSDVRQALRTFLPAPPEPPEVALKSSDDLLLVQQVCALDNEEGKLETGLKHLANMIRDLKFTELLAPCRKAVVSRLTQGFSGAVVFRVEVEDDKRRAEYVIKIVSGDYNLRNIQREIKHWPDVSDTLVPHRLKAHAPGLIAPRYGRYKDQGLVESGGSFAVCYEFLGGLIGKVRDLESVYLEHDPEPGSSGMDPAHDLIDELIHVLREAWYEIRPSGVIAHRGASLERRSLWISADAASKEERVFPPYQLSAWNKSLILKSLEEHEKFGRRLLGAGEWKRHVDKIVCWLKGTHPLLELLGEPRPVLIARAHGDLNSKNILWWEDMKYPFLIDFALYQPQSHVMQDFARLEVEIKFALMDRENTVEDPALDHSSSRLPVWCLVERDLASLGWADATIPLGGRERFVARAFSLVQMIRKRGRELRNATPRTRVSERTFLLEYGSALLYQTLRAIGYTSLSPFKRLLAVFSAAEWIDSLLSCTEMDAL
jgi:Ternary complex associated domain 9